MKIFGFFIEIHDYFRTNKKNNMSKAFVLYLLSGILLAVILHILAKFSLRASIFVGVFTGIVSFFSLEYKRK